MIVLREFSMLSLIFTPCMSKHAQSYKKSQEFDDMISNATE